jgi:hypothetical protein
MMCWRNAFGDRLYFWIRKNKNCLSIKVSTKTQKIRNGYKNLTQSKNCETLLNPDKLS